MEGMFQLATSFDKPLNAWNTESVFKMKRMFSGVTTLFNSEIGTYEGFNMIFNQSIGSWNVSNVTNMTEMFRLAHLFNQPIGEWDVSNVTEMNRMFRDAISFDQPIGEWDVSNVTQMFGMFQNASSFDQPIGEWDVSNLITLGFTFQNALSFNQDIGSWDVSNVTYMRGMFEDASSFNLSLGSWDVSNVTTMENMFDNSGLSTPNYDAILISWSLQNVQSGVELGALGINFCNSIDAKARLIDNYGWNIIDDGYSCATAGVDDQNQLDISIYPNPSSDIVYIDGNYTQLKVVVYDILGKQVMKESITNSVDISHLDNGIYILQLSDGDKLIIQRIIKN
jgi:surface protein